MIETYVPLYRKYRPQQFADLVGQEVVSTAVCNALTLGKIAHAYLFCGPRGTGKTSSARIFAKSLNCVNGPTVTPCQTCPSCVAITHGNALDVTEIDAASNNGVENIRDLTDKVQFSPIEGKYKIYIIDEVHMLSTAAFNALLKTLEEPPPNVVFVFATTEPHRVLPTIISRCQRFDFSRITREQIEARLAQVAGLENINIAPEAVTLIARHVRGGMRDALGLLDQVAVLGRAGEGKTITPEDVRAFIGTLEDDILLDLTQGIQEKNPAQVLQQVQMLQERGVEPGQMVKELTHHLRNLLIAKTCGPQASGDQFDLPPDYYQTLCRQAEGFETEELPQMLSRLSLMEGQLRHSQQPQLWLEVGLLDLCYRQDIHVVKQLAERVQALEQMLQGGAKPVQSAPQPARSSQSNAPQPEPKPERKPVAPVREERGLEPEAVVASATPETPVMEQPALPLPAAPVANTGDLNALWANMLESIQHMLTKALVKDHFKLLEITEKAVTIGYTSDTIYNTFKQSADKNQHLQQAVEAVLGKSCVLRFQQATDEAPVTQPKLVREPVAVGAPQVPVTAPEVEASAPEAESKPTPAMVAERPPVPELPVVMPDADESMDFEVSQAKKYTQDLLQAKVLE